ncbi:CASP-like protein 4A2 [Nomascus leucogenys]|uniref:CASP-like protein 4A2 n=1 Tax=Nomascus leucogenys TaxID=61853 RepID=UPI00122D5136|nr:CASP-like protein 4A2 [Nomascus leucogenys]
MRKEGPGRWRVGETMERRVEQLGPSRGGGIQTPGGGGGGGTRASLLPGGSADKDQEREPSLAARGTAPPAPPRQCLPTPCPPLGYGLRPPARRPGPLPHAAPGPLPQDRGVSSRPHCPPRREQARRARRRRTEGGLARQRGEGRGAARVSHLFSWPRRGWGGRDLSRSASSSCFMEPCAWVGAPERSWPAGGPDALRGRGGAKEAGGRRRKRRGGGGREELEVFPGRLED